MADLKKNLNPSIWASSSGLKVRSSLAIFYQASRVTQKRCGCSRWTININQHDQTWSNHRDALHYIYVSVHNFQETVLRLRGICLLPCSALRVREFRVVIQLPSILQGPGHILNPVLISSLPLESERMPCICTLHLLGFGSHFSSKTWHYEKSATNGVPRRTIPPHGGFSS